jgi:hypothetical protein
LTTNASERERLIEIIERTYPANTRRPGIAALMDDVQNTGMDLLEEARTNTGRYNEWQSEPIVVLREYARLCQEEQARRLKQPS